MAASKKKSKALERETRKRLGPRTKRTRAPFKATVTHERTPRATGSTPESMRG